ncbi:MAG: Protein of unknown function DUF86, Caur_2869 group [uncultured Adhaeribacter sp.]|uniref:Nucleotidyltransferase n=1 Tax=uncultured Adhaeribacter sp. TaxID=448109 RepID=A0A6J4HBK5_9BACT|nr:MAG: Protein of unknown function DUF86, Caur_2869 group [uncultured Adhaeribacter sp.]
MQPDIRWQQRFSSLQKAFDQLEKAVALTSYSNLEREGLIQRFEYNYELSWKTLQDLLEYKGYPDIKGPRPVIEQAYKDGYIADGLTWMAMKKSREATSHTYDENTARAIEAAIKNEYFAVFKALLIRLQDEKNGK